MIATCGGRVQVTEGNVAPKLDTMSKSTGAQLVEIASPSAVVVMDAARERVVFACADARLLAAAAKEGLLVEAVR